LDALKKAGFVDCYWPELSALDEVEQARDFHPEGNAWRHTLETFRYRKTPALFLSLGLLLHDTGKAEASASGRHRFEAHAELGAAAARRFLRRLGFDEATVAGVAFLVRRHMLPAALPRLPLGKRGLNVGIVETLTAPLFPTLLELYRSDEASSFKNLDNYHESAAAYRAWKKRQR
jgi:poly(A) polymerase